MKYKLKDDVDFIKLDRYGYKYTGNYNRGEQWTKKVDDEVIRGIMIKGDWDNRKITFQFPYMNIKYPDIKIYIQDLIDANLVEEVNDNE